MVISTSIDLVRIAPDHVVYFESDGNYSTIVQTDGEVRMVSYQLGQIEKLISSQLGSEGSISVSYTHLLWASRNTSLSKRSCGNG